MRSSDIFALLGLVPSVLSQATHTVMVGVKGSFYDPPTNSAGKGDIIQFIFGGVFHGVTQSSFDNPCMPLPGGFSSGLQGTGGNLTSNFPVWNLIVTNASAPIWFYCQATQPENHCAQGMVGAINAPEDMFANFTSVAKAFVPGPTLPPIVTALTGIGASATAPPVQTGVTSVPASSITSPPSSASFTPAPTETVTSTIPTTSPKRGVSPAVIGGAVGGGGAAVIAVGLLVYLLLRKKSTPSVTYVETSERAHFPGPKPGWSSPEPDIPSLRNRPSDMAYDSSGRTINRQGSRNVLEGSAIRRNESYAASDGSSTVPPVINERDRPNNQLHYENSRGDMRSLTMADALSSHPYAHTFSPAPVASVLEQQEPPRERDPVLDRGPDVDVHELAKEVAALLGPQNPLPAPPNQPLATMPSLRVPHARPPRNLPNPRNFNFGQGVRSPEPDSSLPQYER